MQNILKLAHVSLTYHSLSGETKALEDITFDIKTGEFVAIIGPSGCGKTTILSLISGLLKPTSGKVLLHNKEVLGVSNQTGYMFQKDHLFDWRTIYKNITLGLELQKNKSQAAKAFIQDLIQKYGLADFEAHYPYQLSGGMRQRVALIRTLALNPSLLLLDEPFAALDFQTRLEVCDDVSAIIKKENKTAIFVTHDIGEAISMSDRVIILSARPAKIKKIVDIPLRSLGSPLKRRESAQFPALFEEIYQELKHGT